MTEGPYRDAGAREPEEPPPDPRGPWVLQTWTSSRKCPDCRTLLFAARKEGFRIDACGGFCGAWLDHVTAGRAVDERSLVPAALADLAAAPTLDAPFAPPGRRCPDCQRDLVTQRIGDAGIEVDVCAEHGTWFDPGEMRKFITALARRKPSALDPEVDRIIEAEARLGALRPPANYEPPAGIFGSSQGFDYAGAAGDLLVQLARWFSQR
jgi:Zn-finger nucleic acid-binding protein